MSSRRRSNRSAINAGERRHQQKRDLLRERGEAEQERRAGQPYTSQVIATDWIHMPSTAMSWPIQKMRKLR